MCFVLFVGVVLWLMFRLLRGLGKGGQVYIETPPGSGVYYEEGGGKRLD